MAASAEGSGQKQMTSACEESHKLHVLESVSAHCTSRNLAREDDHGDTIRQSILPVVCQQLRC